MERVLNPHFLLYFTRLIQVVLEGVWGNNRVSGYIAVDDITVFEGNCDSEYRTPISERRLGANGIETYAIAVAAVFFS